MSEGPGTDMLAFLGVPPDERLLADDLNSLPETERHHAAPVSTRQHDRLVAAGSFLTGATLVGGAVLLIFGGFRVLFGSGGAAAVLAVALGGLLVATHWGWVHLAEYVGISIDDRARRGSQREARAWLGGIEPYPRFSVTTGVLGDASIRVVRRLHKPVLTPRGTFTFEREDAAERTFGHSESAAVVAAAVEEMRRAARLDTDRLAESWAAAAAAYDAALLDAAGDEQELAARRAAADALSEHINASLREPPLVE
jgi:hypothetical protein